MGAELRWDDCRGRIVETEAYTAEGDEACHTFMRRGARKFVADHPAGTAYVYLNYGVHWLLNVLIKGGGGMRDGFVLVRAVEPTAGIELMRPRRGPAGLTMDVRNLCSGPGKLTQAFGILGSDHGADLCASVQRGFHRGEMGELVADRRIGITKAADFPWRFLWKGSRHVSVPASRWATAAAPIAPVPSPRR